MYTLNNHYLLLAQKDIPNLSQFATSPGAMINPPELKLPKSRTHFHGPKDVWASDV